MGNFLADLGRSGAGTNMVKGISDLTSDIQNRRLNEQQGQISIQDSRIRAENEAREARAFQYKEKAFLEQQAIDDAPVNITTDQKFLSAPPETQQELLKWGQSQGYWDERGVGKRKFARTALGEIETKPELFDRFMGPVVLAKENEVKRLKTELLKMDSEGIGVDDKKYLEAKALTELKEKQYNQALTMYEGQRNKLLGITAAERKSTEQPIGPNKWGLSETMTFSQAKELGIVPGSEKDPSSDFKLFYQTNKQSGKSDEWISNEWFKRQSQLKQIAPPIYNFVQTGEGVVPGNMRTGKMGQPTGYDKPMPNEMITSNQQIATIQDAAQVVRTLYKKDYVGPIAGRIAPVWEATIGIDPQQSIFNAALTQMNNTLVYLLSGKQINDKEYERLRKQMPDKNLPPKNFIARLDEFDRTFTSIMTERERRQGGYQKSSNKSKLPEGMKQGW